LGPINALWVKKNKEKKANMNLCKVKNHAMTSRWLKCSLIVPNV